MQAGHLSACYNAVVVGSLMLLSTGMDNVRNMTGSPLAGVDPHEFLDIRPLNYGSLPLLAQHMPAESCPCHDTSVS